ncbi:hypothetical protein METESE_29390 [Mesoterricola sediminis]|uniref:Tetratricopeptide repeat protein n=1 Tax=Mesoterricola sediminis TaxID=2927980 RepID=A0AA48GRL8_9BACT|nr:hypothetical protein METESE_29390 [Mesoterricola sediminis]
MVSAPRGTSNSLSVRFYCLTPAGLPLRLTLSGMALIHLEPCPVVVTAFAGHSIRFAELVLRMVDRKPDSVERAGYSLIRFDAKGRPDMDRYRRQSEASIRAHQEAFFDDQGGPGNIVDMRDRFTAMGGRWTPSLQESMLLEQAALGRTKAKTLRFDDETFDLEGGHQAPDPVAEKRGTRIFDELPFPVLCDVRLRKLHQRQPKATPAEVPLGCPVDLVVLATKTTGATCRLQGHEGVLVLRDDPTKDLIPGRVITVKPERVWSYQGSTYLRGEKVANRLDAAALGLVPLALKAWGLWDPKDCYWGEEDQPLEAWARPIVARGPRPSFEFEACLPGTDPEDWESDPIQVAIGDWNSGRKAQAIRVLEALCRADLRCLDAHAHLGAFHFERHPERALMHYQVGVAIGRLSLGSKFDGVLAWGCLGNRPYLRCLHGVGLCMWRLGCFDDAETVFDRLLWLNPSDNQGARFILPEVRARRDWKDFADAEKAEL